MGLRFIIGRAGTGKTHLCIEEIIHQSNTGAKRQILIVPEQFTSQAERDLIAATGQNAILTAEVLSFGRLAHRVFSKKGIGNRLPLGDIGKAMALRKILLAEKDNISTLFAVDDAGVFRGGIDLKDLIVAREDTPLAEITDAAYPVVYANATVEECVPRLVGHSEASVPVLDAGGRLAGVLISQEFLQVMREEYGEDYAMLAGLPAEEDLSEPVRKSVRKRIPWLVVLLFIGLFVSATVGIFESVVAQLPVIMCFQSLILDMAGNVGTQSLAVAIRMLTGQKPGKWKAELVWKETRVGFFNGVLLGELSFLAIGGYLCLKRYPAPFAFAVSGCLAAAMVLAMVASSLSGTLIPMLFRKIGIDPAVASGPLITTINDLVAVVSYYGLAWLILIRWLHLA